jgi:hypothetical protein
VQAQRRCRVELDSAYVSRLLRSLAKQGLVVVEASQDDKRVRRVQLTEAGLAVGTLTSGVWDRMGMTVQRTVCSPQILVQCFAADAKCTCYLRFGLASGNTSL